MTDTVVGRECITVHAKNPRNTATVHTATVVVGLGVYGALSPGCHQAVLGSATPTRSHAATRLVRW